MIVSVLNIKYPIRESVALLKGMGYDVMNGVAIYDGEGKFRDFLSDTLALDFEFWAKIVWTTEEGHICGLAHIFENKEVAIVDEATCFELDNDLCSIEEVLDKKIEKLLYV